MQAPNMISEVPSVILALLKKAPFPPNEGSVVTETTIGVARKFGGKRLIVASMISSMSVREESESGQGAWLGAVFQIKFAVAGESKE
jgi:hypothetical protein